MNAIKEWFKDRWESIIFRLYKKSDHYLEGQMHDALLHDLLDKLGAPKHPGNDPKRLRYGPYGRLRQWVKENDYLVDDKTRKELDIL
ncbi:MAG TPA: hypothetical protein VIW07_13085 [Candidatus Udaeobacter sp.]|jgi:hypothetical protein